MAGHLTTFSLGFSAFQAFTTDFIAVEQRDAVVWNDYLPSSLRQALTRIWPQQPMTRAVSWPCPAFPRAEWRRLVTWMVF